MHRVSIGIDLAWCRKRISALVSLDDTLIVRGWSIVVGDEEILSFAESFAAESKIVCIDAPLLFPENPVAFRSTETEMRQRGIRILPVQQKFFIERFRGLRGLELRKSFEKLGYLFSISEARKQVIEVYPYASWKNLLGEVPRYKNVCLKRRIAALDVLYRALLDAGIRGIEDFDISGENAADILDAVMCAWTGIRHGCRKTTVVGDEARGFIVY
ncbi:MAG: DUF429 domain-containing protein [Thermoplasmata archaeon]